MMSVLIPLEVASLTMQVVAQRFRAGSKENVAPKLAAVDLICGKYKSPKVQLLAQSSGPKRRIFVRVPMTTLVPKYPSRTPTNEPITILSAGVRADRLSPKLSRLL